MTDESLDLQCDWDGIKKPRWRATKPWPEKVFLRYYDVGQTLNKPDGKRYATFVCENGRATYQVIEDHHGDFEGTLEPGSEYYAFASSRAHSS